MQLYCFRIYRITRKRETLLITHKSEEWTFRPGRGSNLQTGRALLNRKITFLFTQPSRNSLLEEILVRCFFICVEPDTTTWYCSFEWQSYNKMFTFSWRGREELNYTPSNNRYIYILSPALKTSDILPMPPLYCFKLKFSSGTRKIVINKKLKVKKFLAWTGIKPERWPLSVQHKDDTSSSNFSAKKDLLETADSGEFLLYHIIFFSCCTRDSHTQEGDSDIGLLWNGCHQLYTCLLTVLIQWKER